MGVIGIAKNLILHGPVGTYRIYQDRQASRLAEERKKELSRLENLELRKEFDERMKKQGKKSIDEKQLKSFFVKEVFPKIYAEESKKPVEDKVVFMERGVSVSPSLKYMRSYIRKNTDYKIRTFSLNVNAVSNQEYFENAKDYIREAATAKAVFNCTANDLMSYLTLRPETTYIQLWHGCGAFKSWSECNW